MSGLRYLNYRYTVRKSVTWRTFPHKYWYGSVRVSTGVFGGTGTGTGTGTGRIFSTGTGTGTGTGLIFQQVMGQFDINFYNQILKFNYICNCD